VLEVAPSGYYAWRQGRSSQRREANQQLVEEIAMIHAASHKSYGSPRIHAELCTQGNRCNHKRVARLMREHGIRAQGRRRRKPLTTDSDHALPIAPNLLRQDFSAHSPNTKWVADITYVTTQAGWLYLAVVLDLFSRKVVGWAMDTSMTTTLVTQALRMALHSRRPPPQLVHHSDRGGQYASHAYQALLRTNAVTVSMSRPGHVYDNAVMESFFASLKTELVHQRHFRTFQEAKSHLFAYIEGFYNRRRRHSSLGYLSPDDFERPFFSRS
jgi:transposase InsO family protein